MTEEIIYGAFLLHPKISKNTQEKLPRMGVHPSVCSVGGYINIAII